MKYLFLVSIFFCSTFSTFAQTTEKKLDGCQEYGGIRRTVLKSGDRRFKIKSVVGANSGTAREADYVEFKTMEKSTPRTTHQECYSTKTPPSLVS